MRQRIFNLKNGCGWKRMLAACGMMVVGVVAAVAADIHVATTGSDENAGTEAAPLLTIHKAIERVQPGDRILIHEGTYYITERIKIPELNTNPDLRCEMRAWPDEAAGKVIIDGTNMNPASEIGFKQSRCIYVNHLANYWTFYGLVLQHAKDNGMKMEGSYNIVERCTFRYNNDTGLQIGMYKDFSIEETKSFPISGMPQFNPGYSYCRGNKVINCDSYENADVVAYGGKSDDGGDADGFAVKLFPGPGTEFHGCRAWNNSDDNWDLYMTYHPVVIDHCWAYHAGYYTNAGGTVVEGKNGNGFKLGGGGSAGGAAFDQSVGAHVVTNCVAFGNLHKGFDQNNAYEGMYVINCTAWGNEYNYRFPTVFKFGPMTIRNSIGWGATAQKSGVAVGNHEFLSEDKEGYIAPDTRFCSWLEIDGCNPIKEGMKDSNKNYLVTKDHSGEFLSLSVDDFMAEREADGSLPNNNFARLKPGSIFKDQGTPIIGFTPMRKMTEEDCRQYGLDYITADDLYIPYNDGAPDLGAYEIDGTPFEYTIPEKIVLKCITANSSQEVVEGQAIADIVYEWNDVCAGANVESLPSGLRYSIEGKTLTISGTPTEGGTYRISAYPEDDSQSKPVVTTGSITLVTPFKVLTGDWYHFQDAADALPADLQGVLELIDGDKGETTIDPAKEETASGYSVGAVSLAQSDGGIRLNLANGLLQLKLNVYFTGGRTFKISWTLADSTTGSKTTGKYSKGAYEWDIVELAGLDEATAKQVRTITFAQSGANGGARIYDMYVRVPLNQTDGIRGVMDSGDGQDGCYKTIQNGRIMIVKSGQHYNLQGLKEK
ncbi:MAG: right-handed parallel beta-helix repeat-containing protein [Prevotella sp.]|nr:right-handed parallel beta-helix repeat-containing protein [Prevotella sp.]